VPVQYPAHSVLREGKGRREERRGKKRRFKRIEGDL
jgi:hypothetical protein